MVQTAVDCSRERLLWPCVPLCERLKDRGRAARRERLPSRTEDAGHRATDNVGRVGDRREDLTHTKDVSSTPSQSRVRFRADLLLNSEPSDADRVLREGPCCISGSLERDLCKSV